MKRILIAGKGSYIGQSLVRFVEENNLPCEMVELDVQDPAWRTFDFSGFDSVVLVAGIAHRKETDENRSLYYEVNRDLAYEVAKASKAAGVPHFVMLSTMSVYGVNEGVITPDTPPAPKSAYGESKLEGEQLIHSLEDGQFKVAILRPPMVYGPGCKGNFNSLARLTLTLPVFPLVENRRSMVYIDNLCAFIMMCVADQLSGTLFPQDDEYMNTSEMARLIAEANGKKLQLSASLGAPTSLLKGFVGKARKAFGTLIYENTEQHSFSYCVVSQEAGVRKSAEALAKSSSSDADGPIKVTLVAGYYPPEQSADTRLNKDLAEGLAARGAEVTVIVPFPTRGVTQEQQAEYIDRSDERVSPRLRIIRVGKPADYHQGIARRGIDFLAKSASLYKVAREIETDVYLVVSTPPFLGYVAALLARETPVVFKLQDVFPDSLMYLKDIGEKNPAAITLRRLERWVYSSVTSIVVPSADMQDTVSPRGATPDKTRVIPDWVDEEACYPIAREENHLFDDFGLDRTGFYACYAGNIGQLQDVETVVEAATMLATEQPDIKIVIIGDGSRKDAVRKLSAGLDNVLLFPMQPTEDIAAVYSLGDVGIVSLKTGITKIALPSKTWDILSAGRAVLCEVDVNSRLAATLRDNGCGMAVNPEDARDIADALLSFYQNVDETRSMGERGRSLLLDQFSSKNALDAYFEFLKTTCKR